MVLSKIPPLLLISLVMLHSCQAQNSPQDYLNAHNAARAAVCIGPVRWDSSLEAYAQNYANTRINDCELIHSFGHGLGENIAKGYPSLTGVAAVDLWIKEKENYDYNSDSCVGGGCRHYTQVVWRSSDRLGCARVKCNNGWDFVTCNYSPPGNCEGQRPY